MQVSDKFSAYFSVTNFSTKSQLETHIRENTQRFSYGNATYPLYEKKYHPQGYQLRKIVAIPAALCAGVVNSIYHLAKAIFYGIPKACCGEIRHLKADAFRVVRDFEEGLGWLVTLFNDKRGSHLIQESLFHKECYNYFEQVQKKVNSLSASGNHSSYSESRIDGRRVIFSRTVINGVEIPHYDEAQKTSLRDFRDMSPSAQQDTIEKFQLKDAIDAMGEESFFKKLNEANLKALELVSLLDLKLEGMRNFSKVKFALLNDTEFKKVTVSDLKDASRQLVALISKRIKLVEDTLPQEFPCVGMHDLPIVYFDRMSGQTISKALDIIPENIFVLLNDNQIKNLNFTNASEKKINEIFSYIDGKEERRRFALLSTGQVQAILVKLGEFQLKLISEKQLGELDVSGLSREKLQQLFCYIDGKEEKKRFALLSIEQVQTILVNLDNYRLGLISDKQLKRLDLSGLSQTKLQEIFCYIDGKEEKRRFSLLSKDQVQGILSNLDAYRLSLISDYQLQQIDLSPLSKEKLKQLFCYIDGKEEKRRFAILSKDQLQGILGNLSDYQFELISNDQYIHLKQSGCKIPPELAKRRK